MLKDRVVSDIMVDVFEFPHIPYWFSIRQAAGIFKATIPREDKCFNPMGILVFDEKYNLLGTLNLKSILKGLEPSFLRPSSKAQVLEEDIVALSSLWDAETTRESAERPVSDIMVPARILVAPDDPVTKAAFLMMRHDLTLMPVLDGRKKLVGMVRIVEVFDALTDSALKD